MVSPGHVPMGLNFSSKNKLTVKVTPKGVTFFHKKEIRWETREKKIKANAKNRKKARTP
jgi:biopolymer transport protein ExbD